jgi:undecaprenyl-diphosphatase
MSDYMIAVLLGIIEGLTEFLPISSTGHLILAERFLRDGAVPDTFETMIQLGAVLAVVVLYFEKLWGAFITIPTNPRSRQFAAAVIVGFLPAMIIGYILHDFIKEVLFSPFVVSWALVVGGVLILLAERFRPTPTVLEVDDITIATGLKIGFCQCLAMIPGMSRSGATIIGAMLMGVDRKPAAEYSFFLAIPTMLGVFVYEGWSSRAELLAQGGRDLALIAIGFVVSFVSAIIVIKLFIGIVQRMGFAPFAWYRIIVGTGMLILFWPR